MVVTAETRQRHQDLAWSLVPDRIARRMVAPGPEQTHEVAELLAWARTHSRFHAERLAGVEQLADAPVMTKTDLMEHWDDVCTDERITLAAAEAHLERTTTPEYLAGDVMVVASGGSSGTRGVFAWGWHDLAQAQAIVVRGIAVFPQPDQPAVRVMIGAAGAHHMTTCLLTTFPPPGDPFVQLPATMPLDRLVSELNTRQPTHLGAYASIAHALALELLAGRLDIAPVGVTTTAEPLLPEARAAIREAFGFEPMNLYGTSDVNVVAVGCPGSRAMHLNEDVLVVEVEPDRILVTNLINRTLPLIRYELTDEVTLIDEPCSCGSPFRLIADVQGRADDWFNYPAGVRVHPHGLRSVLTRDGSIAEYRVTQTPTGADVDIRVTAAVDRAALTRQLAASLETSGLREPVVHVRTVDRIERTGIGKLKRFVPLET